MGAGEIEQREGTLLFILPIWFNHQYSIYCPGIMISSPVSHGETWAQPQAPLVQSNPPPKKDPHKTNKNLNWHMSKFEIPLDAQVGVSRPFWKFRVYRRLNASISFPLTSLLLLLFQCQRIKYLIVLLTGDWALICDTTEITLVVDTTQQQYQWL